MRKLGEHLAELLMEKQATHRKGHGADEGEGVKKDNEELHVSDEGDEHAGKKGQTCLPHASWAT